MHSPVKDAARLAERHRPRGLAIMRQRWTSLLFLHWAWSPEIVQATLPPGLFVDTYEDKAWLGIVPFFMKGVRPAFFPPVPGLSYFMELNLRTYVYDEEGRPGVWFYSLDANNWFAVKAARAGFFLPYQHAAMHSQTTAGRLKYHSHRRGEKKPSRFDYRAEGEAKPVQPGTLEFFLVERYRLFAFDPKRRRVLTGMVAHRPYEVSAAEVTAWDDEVIRQAGFALPPERLRAPDHICAARDVAVEIFPPGKV